MNVAHGRMYRSWRLCDYTCKNEFGSEVRTNGIICCILLRFFFYIYISFEFKCSNFHVDAMSSHLMMRLNTYTAVNEWVRYGQRDAHTGIDGNCAQKDREREREQFNSTQQNFGHIRLWLLTGSLHNLELNITEYQTFPLFPIWKRSAQFSLSRCAHSVYYSAFSFAILLSAIVSCMNSSDSLFTVVWFVSRWLGLLYTIIV